MSIKGVLFIFCEQGMGAAYALQDERFISPPTKDWPHERWSYDGLIYLKNGDHLKVWAPDGSVFWEGEFQLDAAGRILDIDTNPIFGQMFVKEYRAELTQ